MMQTLLLMVAGQSGLLEAAAHKFFEYGIVGVVAVVEAVILYFVGKWLLNSLKEDKARLLLENEKLREERAAEKAESIKLMLELNAALERATRHLPRRKDET